LNIGNKDNAYFWGKKTLKLERGLLEGGDGIKIDISRAMMAITTSSSISVKPLDCFIVRGL
jgi:hypothetical protein